MVREIHLLRSAARPGTRTLSGWNRASWDCGEFARLLQRHGYHLQSRACGEGSWAVMAERDAQNRFAVATGLASCAEAADWIERERLLDRKTYNTLASSLPMRQWKSF